MPCAPASPETKAVTPHSDLAAFFIERNYKALGCNGWNTRRVQLLCAKLGDTPAMLAVRLRVRPAELTRRFIQDSWTAQDGLILTIIERQIDFEKGGVLPVGSILQ